jgi:putative endonuclease
MDLAASIAEVLRRSRRPNSGEAAHIALGRRGEEIAARFLRKNGHRILYTNFRAPEGGEVDIVSRDKRHNELVFTEVKTRTNEDFGAPSEAVDRKKQRLVLRGAMKWLRMLDFPDITYRFDIVEVVIGPPLEVRHLENAFQIPSNYLR